MELHWIVLYLHFKIQYKSVSVGPKLKTQKWTPGEWQPHLYGSQLLGFCLESISEALNIFHSSQKTSGTKSVSVLDAQQTQRKFSSTDSRSGSPWKRAFLFWCQPAERLDLFLDVGTIWCSKVGRGAHAVWRVNKEAKEAHRPWLCWNSPLLLAIHEIYKVFLGGEDPTLIAEVDS